MPTFYTPINRARAFLTADHVVGDGVLVVDNGAIFGNPSSSNPVKVTAIAEDVHFGITGRSANTLTIGGMLEGSSDVGVPAGHGVEVRITAKDISDLQSAIQNISTLSASAGPSHAIQTSDGSGGFSGTQDLVYSGGTLTLSGYTYAAGQTILFATDTVGDTLLRLTDTGSLHIGGGLTVGDTLGPLSQAGTLRLVEDGSHLYIGTYSMPAGAQVHLNNNATTDTALRIVAADGQTAPLVTLQGLSSTGVPHDLGYLDAGYSVTDDATYTGWIGLSSQDHNGTSHIGIKIDSDGTKAVVTLSGAVSIASLTGLLKGTTGLVSAAVAGTDYLTPTGSGSGLTGITESQVSGLTSDLAAKAPTASPTFSGTVAIGSLSGILKAASGTVSTATAGTDYLTPTGNGSGLTLLNASSLSSGTVATARLGTGTADTTTYLRGDGTWSTVSGGSGTVTSVALTVPGVLFSVSGSPVTTSGTLAFTLLTQTANTVLAGPTTGSAASPTFRSLVAEDIPAITESGVTNLTSDLAAKAALASPTFSGTITLASLTGLLKGASGVVSAATEGTDYLSGASNKLPLPFSFGGTGTPTVANDVCPWLYVPFAATANRLTLTAGTSPTGNFTVVIKRSADSGSTFPDTIATVTVSSGTKLTTTTTMTNAALAAGDLLRLDITAVNAAANWTARLGTLSRNQ